MMIHKNRDKPTEFKRCSMEKFIKYVLPFHDKTANFNYRVSLMDWKLLFLTRLNII